MRRRNIHVVTLTFAAAMKRVVEAKPVAHAVNECLPFVEWRRGAAGKRLVIHNAPIQYRSTAESQGNADQPSNPLRELIAYTFNWVSGDSIKLVFISASNSVPGSIDLCHFASTILETSVTEKEILPS